MPYLCCSGEYSPGDLVVHFPGIYGAGKRDSIFRDFWQQMDQGDRDLFDAYME